MIYLSLIIYLGKFYFVLDNLSFFLQVLEDVLHDLSQGEINRCEDYRKYLVLNKYVILGSVMTVSFAGYRTYSGSPPQIFCLLNKLYLNLGVHVDFKQISIRLYNVFVSGVPQYYKIPFNLFKGLSKIFKDLK